MKTKKFILSKENAKHRAIQRWCESRQGKGRLIFDSARGKSARRGVNYGMVGEMK